jgi:hypothetical protein
VEVWGPPPPEPGLLVWRALAGPGEFGVEA